jgi:hypothetical protein
VQARQSRVASLVVLPELSWPLRLGGDCLTAAGRRRFTQLWPTTIGRCASPWAPWEWKAGGTGPDDGPVMDGLRGQGTGLQVASRLIERGADVNAGAARLFGRLCVCDA